MLKSNEENFMHILISPNAFKHSISAWEAAKAIKIGFEKSKLGAFCTIFPIADGGNGTMELCVEKLEGVYKKAEVHDPLGRKINSKYGYIPSSKTAVIEMAEASGIHLLSHQERDPFKASTYGTGELIIDALNSGAEKVIIGVGGSATVDAGVGMLQALGVEFTDQNNQVIPPGKLELDRISFFNLSNLDHRIEKLKIIVACDVNNPLLGENGAARVFGPQKGASNADIEILEKNLESFNSLIIKNLNKNVASLPKGGAAGGISASLHAFFGAELVNGLEYLLNLTNYSSELTKADLVISAEGKVDSQTLEGKGPFALAQIAREHKIPVIIFAGQVTSDLNLQSFENIEAILPICPGPVSLEEALENAESNLTRTAEHIGNILNLSF
ncbi:glycerate kinase [soil metagenome]